jgi:hypothetical protein
MVNGGAVTTAKGFDRPGRPLSLSSRPAAIVQSQLRLEHLYLQYCGFGGVNQATHEQLIDFGQSPNTSA